MTATNTSGASLLSKMLHIKVAPVVLAACIPILLIMGQLVRMILPAKYFYDSSSILNMVNGDAAEYKFRDITYRRTADFYSAINIFHFSTLTQWSLLLAIIGSIMLVPVILKLPKLSLIDFTFALCFIGVLNIFTFTISKDMIQFSVFYIAAICTTLKEHSKVIPIVSISILLFLESIFYRQYYLLVFVFFMLYAATTIYISRRCSKSSKLRRQAIIIGYLFLIVIVFLILVFLIVPSKYNQLIMVRSVTNSGRSGSPDSNSLITEIFHSTNPAIAVVNFVLDGFRMMFPFELLRISLKYTPFIILQLLLVFEIYKQIIGKKLSQPNRSYFAFCLLMAFLMVSFFFEPDFGSWIRHESCIFPLICSMLSNKPEHLDSERNLNSSLESHQGLPIPSESDQH